jgi:hypothetical protein
MDEAELERGIQSMRVGWGTTRGRSQYESIKRAQIIGLANILPILDPDNV